MDVASGAPMKSLMSVAAIQWQEAEHLLEPEISHGLLGSVQGHGPGLIPMSDLAGDPGGSFGAEADFDQIPLQVIHGVRLQGNQSTCRIVGCHARLPARSPARLDRKSVV